MSEVKIVPFEEKYTQEIVDLIIPIQREEFNIQLTVEDQPDLLTIQEEYINTGGNFWVALFDDKVIGTIALVRLENHCGAIKKMFVTKDFRGEKQIGRKLLDTLVNSCKEQGYERLYLGTVEVLKAAQKFYKKNGFELIDKTEMPKDYHLMDVDTVFFMRKLTEN
ncbi:N-acetyltransferase (plasmid) [Enterococcus gilvus]|jgi:N-acetylglutamate synthase-like GNAT family acetyltransferase|uniref:GNAT family N-acetyltransferase n=1 Tax=Enterococcus gilvus TaxID=160453 RepID=UPI000DF5F386|nr:GNAT family N-acetyltransferase [Enterococcus gilvus]AXG40136.1 N-acetyltransferase [Enterococcus gilvus]